MRVLIALTYYRPYASGLTIYAQRLARALVDRGHQVTVLASQHLDSLPREELMDGVRVVRAPVTLRIGKGPLMPSFAVLAGRLLREADVVNPHLPQLDAAPLSLFARRQGVPSVATYHCDLVLPPGPVNWLANRAATAANHVAARQARVIVTNTRDYAEHSHFLRRYLRKVAVVPPPVVLAPAVPGAAAAFRAKYGLRADDRLIGMAGRLAAEKGVEYLVEALPLVLRRHPNARVVSAGPFQNVPGEEAYAERLRPLIAALGDRWRFLGHLPDDELTAFYQAIDVLALPSINSTESYGMVQVEAMTCGAPAVATDLPGVRVPVRETGLGAVVPPRDAQALADALIRVLDAPPPRDPARDADLARRSSPAAVAEAYEALFEQASSEQRTAK